MDFDCLLFDADNTLFDYERAEAEALKEAFAAFGYPFEGEILQIYKDINDPLWKRFERGEIKADYIRDRRFALLLARLGLEGDPAALNEAYLGALGSQTWETEGARKTLEALEGRFKMALVTNGLSKVQRKRLSLSPLARFFPVVAISEEVGSAKPEPRIFSWALDRLGARGGERTLVIGDSLSADIAGAIAAGLASCWYDRARRPEAPVPKPDFRIAALEELLPIVDG
jgi:2-haloacid dehalogenase